MDPFTATTTATISLYQAGGLVLVLIVLGIVGISFMARWFMSKVDKLGQKLDEVRGEVQDILVGCVSQNTVSNNELKGAIIRNTAVIEQQTDCMRERPCLIDDAARRIQTPLPEGRKR